MIKKGLLTLLVLILYTNIISAQKHNVVNASIALRNEEYVDAKKYIDEAYETESTSNDAKMWNYRAPIYLQIALKEPTLDKDAAFKATEAYIKCLQKDKKGRVVVRKWTSEEDILAGLIQCGYKLFNVAIDKYNTEDYKESLKCYNAIFDIIPLDTEDQLKRGNITKETIYMNSYLATSKIKDNKQSKEFLQKLIDINFNEPDIFRYMSSILYEEGKSEEALMYLSTGREMFEDDQGLIEAEINLYLKLGKSGELIEKLSNAIELNPDNDIFYVVRGTCYQNNNEIEKAIIDYNFALEINPEQTIALNNISSCLLKQTDPIVKKMNNLSLSQTSKFNKLKLDLKNLYLKTLPYVKKYLELEPNDKSILNVLAEIYTKLEMYKEAKEIKARISDLK